MSVFTICGVSLICAIAVLMLREYNSRSRAHLLTLVGIITLSTFGVLLFYGEIKELFSLLETSSLSRYSSVVIKSFGVAFVVELCSDILRELESDRIAKSLEFAGKAEILLLCIGPIKDLVGYAFSLKIQAV